MATRALEFKPAKFAPRSPDLSRSDDAILDSVRRALADDPAFCACYIAFAGGFQQPRSMALCPEGAQGEIKIAVSDGIVTLSGTVPALLHRRLAGVLVGWLPGVLNVVDFLEVEDRKGNSDEELAKAVLAAIERDPDIDLRGISVEAQDGLVTLEGLVETEAQVRAASSDAQAILGVRAVKNCLRPREFGR